MNRQRLALLCDINDAVSPQTIMPTSTRMSRLSDSTDSILVSRLLSSESSNQGCQPKFRTESKTAKQQRSRDGRCCTALLCQHGARASWSWPAMRHTQCYLVSLIIPFSCKLLLTSRRSGSRRRPGNRGRCCSRHHFLQCHRFLSGRGADGTIREAPPRLC